MPVNIEGQEFTGFPGFDVRLHMLSYEGRVHWLRYRFELVFLTPFRQILQMEAVDCYIWLCVVSLISAAAQALSGFVYARGTDAERFSMFLRTYLPSGAFNAPMEFDDPRADRHPSRTSAAQFYKFFRNGLAHSFCIEWGGLQHRQEVPGAGPSYLFEAHQGPAGERSLGVIPRELVQDFLAGVERFFTTVEAFAIGGQERAIFNRCFERVFMAKARRPLP
jgi:hypothetical protein